MRADLTDTLGMMKFFGCSLMLYGSHSSQKSLWHLIPELVSLTWDDFVSQRRFGKRELQFAGVAPDLNKTVGRLMLFVTKQILALWSDSCRRSCLHYCKNIFVIILNSVTRRSSSILPLRKTKVRSSQSQSPLCSESQSPLVCNTLLALSTRSERLNSLPQILLKAALEMSPC